MKSTSIQKTARALSSRRWNLPNTMNFPQALRDAIPTLARCWGRSLVLSSISGHAIHDAFWGKRVRVKFLVEESGKLTGKFDVWMDIDPAAARGMARALEQLAEEAEGD